MKKILKIAILAVITAPLFAQTTDLRYGHQYALAFTMPSLHGNARFVGMGGAFGALGGNLSALTTNPASIGIYRRSDISFTSTLGIGSTEARQLDNATSDWQFDDRMNFNVMNFGMVNAFDISRSDSPNEWKMLQFGFGVNRKADFWNRSTFTGFVDDWTFLDQVTLGANNRGTPAGTIEGVARRAGVIFWDADLQEYANDLWWPENGVWQHHGLTQFQTTETRGGINEWFMTFGGNFGDMLYLGATVGMPTINFRQTRDLREVDDAGAHGNYFSSWHLRESLQINGTGVNLKLGAILRPAEFMRIGLAFHTPTRFSLRENLTLEVSGTGEEIRPGHHRERLDQFEYSLRTPMRLIGSLGFVIGRYAMIGIEYEHINFGNMRFTGGDPRFNSENNNFIRDNNAVGGVFRVGGEFRLDPVSIRVGYNYTLSPFEDRSTAFQNFSGHTFSAGLGFVLGSTTIDLAYVNNLRSFDMQPYTGVQLPFNNYNVSAQQFKVTFGWRF